MHNSSYELTVLQLVNLAFALRENNAQHSALFSEEHNAAKNFETALARELWEAVALRVDS